MESEGLGHSPTCKHNLGSVLDRNGSEQPLHIKRHHDLVVLNHLTTDTIFTCL